jgi:branched-subunit amino acid aminotransferase/4-amino-4-deoxychorismate lyase
MSAMPDFAPWLGVFETLRVVDGVPLFIEAHRAELHRASRAVGLSVQLDISPAVRELAGRSGRWRWIVDGEGTRTLFAPEPAPTGGPVTLSLSPLRVGSQNWDARFKTFSYLTHAQALSISGTDEAVLRNEQGNVASAARANLFWRRGARLYTPAHEAGCRCGVVRGFVLGLGPVEVGHFALDELVGADEIFLTNSIRGIVSVRSLEGSPLADFSHADEIRRQYDRAVKEMVRADRGGAA